MTKIINVYNSILNYSGMESDEKGYISARIGDHKDPSTMDGKRLVLPTDNQLRMFNPDEKMVFHPLSENILRGESQVLIKLKHSINVRINYAIGMVAQSLLNIVASPALHSKLSADQSDILIAIKDADEKTVANFMTLMLSGMKNKSDKVFSNIYLKRGGTVNNERFSRVGVVSFPFYDDIVNDRVEKIRVKDKETYKQLFEFMFPDIATPEAYNYGTKTNVAPYLDALMNSSLKISAKLNDIVEMYADFIDEPEALRFDGEWIEYFQDLDALVPDIRRIPVQQGNDGSISITEQREEATQVQQPVQYQPQVQQVAAPQTMPQPVMQPAPVYQPVPQQPSVKNTGRGLDWKSLAASNASIAYSNQPNPLQTQIVRQHNNNVMQQQMVPQQQMQLPPGMMMYPNGQIGPIVQQPMMMQQQPMMQPQVMIPPGMMLYSNGQIGPIPQNMMQPTPMVAPGGYSPATTGFGYRS